MIASWIGVVLTLVMFAAMIGFMVRFEYRTHHKGKKLDTMIQHLQEKPERMTQVRKRASSMPGPRPTVELSTQDTSPRN